MRYIIIKSKGTIFKSLNDQGRKRYIKYTQTCKKVCLVLANTPVLVPKRIDLFFCFVVRINRHLRKTTHHISYATGIVRFFVILVSRTI